MKRDKIPHIKGEISEVMVAAAFVAKQIPIAKPFGAIQRFDLIADLDGLKKIQIKTGSMKLDNRSFKFNVNSSKWNYGSVVKRVGDRTYKGEIDYFAVYVPFLKEVYLVPIQTVTTTSKMSLSLIGKSHAKACDFLFYKF